MAATVLTEYVSFSKPSNSTLYHEPSANTAAVCSLSSSDTEPSDFWVLRSVQCSYDGTPTGGALTVTDGTDTWKVDITSAGFFSVSFVDEQRDGWRFPADTTVTITLAAGGSGVSGICNARDSFIVGR